jgi:hypothetical protein
MGGRERFYAFQPVLRAARRSNSGRVMRTSTHSFMRLAPRDS